MTEHDNEARNGLMNTIGRYLKLLVEDTRLGLAEKLTRLLSAITVCALLAVLALVALLFITIGVSHMLQPALSPMWAYMAVAAFYILLIVVLIAFKRQLVVDPIARFISSLIIEPPVSTHSSNSNDKPAPVS